MTSWPLRLPVRMYGVLWMQLVEVDDAWPSGKETNICVPQFCIASKLY